MNPSRSRTFSDLHHLLDFDFQFDRLREILAHNADLEEVRGPFAETPLHVAVRRRRLEAVLALLDAGADLAGDDHHGTPLVWLAHGSRFSGGADERRGNYLQICQMLLEAGASLADPENPVGDSYGRRLVQDAAPQVAALLRRFGAR